MEQVCADNDPKVTCIINTRKHNSKSKEMLGTFYYPIGVLDLLLPDKYSKEEYLEQLEHAEKALKCKAATRGQKEIYIAPISLGIKNIPIFTQKLCLAIPVVALLFNYIQTDTKIKQEIQNDSAPSSLTGLYIPKYGNSRQYTLACFYKALQLPLDTNESYLKNIIEEIETGFYILQGPTYCSKIIRQTFTATGMSSILTWAAILPCDENCLIKTDDYDYKCTQGHTAMPFLIINTGIFNYADSRPTTMYILSTLLAPPQSCNTAAHLALLAYLIRTPFPHIEKETINFITEELAIPLNVYHKLRMPTEYTSISNKEFNSQEELFSNKQQILHDLHESLTMCEKAGIVSLGQVTKEKIIIKKNPAQFPKKVATKLLIDNKTIENIYELKQKIAFIDSDCK